VFAETRLEMKIRESLILSEGEGPVFSRAARKNALRFSQHNKFIGLVTSAI
jgi:hypothetical protein